MRSRLSRFAIICDRPRCGVNPNFESFRILYTFLKEWLVSTTALVQDLSYPIGKFSCTGPLSGSQRDAAIETIAQTPAKLGTAVRGLSAHQLDTPYRPGGWTVRQLAHHVPDAHLNAYIRTKLILTEDEPLIKPFDERAWAELTDSWRTPIETSLVLLEVVHERWNQLLRAAGDADFARTFRHPEHGVRTLDWMVSLYAWHGLHHVAHVTSLREKMGWA